MKIAETFDFDARSRSPKQQLVVDWRYFYENESLLRHYRKEEIAYTLIKLYEGNLIAADYKVSKSIVKFKIKGLTERGQALLQGVTDDSIWEEAKKKIGKDIESVSFIVLANCLQHL